ncbi:MAG: deoxyribodipyrimidine photo-lyase [Acidimicrobiales bacterium]
MSSARTLQTGDGQTGDGPDAPVIVWFRRDLRLTDNPAWADAVARRSPIVASYVLDPRLLASAGDLRRRLFVAHLHELDRTLREHGGRLRVLQGDATVVVPRLVAELGATAVFVNGDTTPYAKRRDTAVAAALGERLVSHWGTLVHPPGSVLTKAGAVSQVFTPFHRTWEATEWAAWPELPDDARPTVIDEVGVGLPPLDGDPPEPAGEAGALARLAAFDERADRYLDDRDRPAVEGTSLLSADLRFGTLSPRRVATHIGVGSRGRAGFVRQLAWRDWYAHLLDALPHLTTSPMKPDVGEIAWRDDPDGFDAWVRGKTGFPIVDAGMRELAATGRMHNRVRMLTASFLVKDLLVDWRLGEQHFRRALVDGDVAQNVGNWQWAAGTGPDAAPYFRVFNPTLQSRKFDADGEYIRRWVPELAGLDATAIHEPAAVGPLELAAAGVVLDADYPAPIVDHHRARDRALDAYAAAKERAASGGRAG